MYETLLHFLHQTSKSFFYLGVGSCPHLQDPTKLDPKYDQLLPCFVKDIAQNKKEKIQILHIDPKFANQIPFLHAYFAIHLPDAVFYDMDTMYIWETTQMQVIFASCSFEHPSSKTQDNHLWFLEALIDEALSHSFRMVYQEYTGYEIQSLFLRLYEQSHQKKRFRNLILFDVSYGNAIGCSTDMSKYKPIYESNGLFLNIQLLSNEELLAKVDEFPSIREILRRNLIRDYRRILNEIHVDYRRLLNGDPVVCPANYGYHRLSTPEEIMQILQRNLFKLIPLLQKVGLLSLEGTQELTELFYQYQVIDRYKWYQSVFELVKFD